MAGNCLDEDELLQLAPQALLAVARVATEIGAKNRDRHFGTLGAELAVLSQNLESYDTPLQREKSRRRIRKLLGAIERACAWPQTELAEGFTLIQKLGSHAKPEQQILSTVKQGLVAYASGKKLHKLVQLIRGFTSSLDKAGRDLVLDSSPATYRVGRALAESEYPKHVKQQLYQTIRKYAKCNCLSDKNDADAIASHKEHISRLRLRPSRNVEEGLIWFDMLFSSQPAVTPLPDRVEWQHLKIQVSSKRAGAKRARFCSPDNSLTVSEPKTTSIMGTEFCRYLQPPSGSQICLRVHESQFLLLENSLPLEVNILPYQSLSLSDTLQVRHMSNKMRVILAYIIARSVWEFYDSDWMSRHWSADDIQFMQELWREGDRETLIFINRPYISVQRGIADNESSELSTSFGQIHRFPRILSLGLMMVEIGAGKPLKELFPEHQNNVNADWLAAREFLSKPKPWDDFDYKRYWDAARSCIFNQFLIIGPASSVIGQGLADIEDRRRMILAEVVRPLEDLLVGTGWIDELLTVEPTKSLDARYVLISSLATSSNAHTSSNLPMEKRQVSTNNADMQSYPADTLEKHNIGHAISQQRSHAGLRFEIAIVCALPLEADAVISLFDAHLDANDGMRGKAAKDLNEYTAGRMGRHNIVVVHMRDSGKVNAASVVHGLSSSFEHIQLAIVVGICGGIPYDSRSKEEIFLGDVIISRSLIQYDFGRQHTGSFVAKDSLQGGSGRSALEIGSMLSKLETQYHRSRFEVDTGSFLKILQQKSKKARYLGPDADRLFESSALHKHHQIGYCSTCASSKATRICEDAVAASCEDLGCVRDGFVRRIRSVGEIRSYDGTPRETLAPSVHIGKMGSADTLMRSAMHRDEVARRCEVIGFEMEGAGIWDFFPSVVIKALCDYADSHKNKDWQNYAAAAAAAATKAFLKQWRSDIELDPG
ncbi:hypothetical protein LTR99_009178 [Exophiala xenobiotica]|uniref:Nucleoside phosphorylase domain-containing protein n=1 Tax=Vermiconidia calcicola TaxID=1690605 RepID=A0AAV9PZ69_9PEZI|nr:hypothetical protein LTR99_009178 [Exophiala xenobiotica]KAK5532444.1 hypothetical protein LTR25_007977 [Vermiconidia calcicola]